jgi:menaquinol-cytochrome c reductase iron-sulfur subunit
MLIGIVVAWSIVIVGAVVAIVFAALWIRDIARGSDSELTHAPEVAPETRAASPSPSQAAEPLGVGTVSLTSDRYPRSVFLEAGTLGLGAVIGGLITLPVLGFALGPSLLKQGVPDVDIGPVTNFPEGKFIVTTFTSQPEEGDVSRRTAFIRNNGLLENLPSFTIISNHCAHLGCPVQPNGPPVGDESHWRSVDLHQYDPSGFGCPCHGGQYDTEGNRIAGPPVRALDRYSFQVKGGHLFIGAPFSVAKVDGTGAEAQIHKVKYAFPGEHVSGIESWLYPIQPPH